MSTPNLTLVGGSGRCGSTIFTQMLGCFPGCWAFPFETRLWGGSGALGDFAEFAYKHNAFLDSIEHVDDSEHDELMIPEDERYDKAMAKFFSAIEHARNRTTASGKEVGIARYGAWELVKHDAWLTYDRNCPVLMEDVELLLETAGELGFADTIIEKTPRNLIVAEWIHRLHPSARFVHLVRNGLDVFGSMNHRGIKPIAGYDADASYWGDVINDITMQQRLVPAEQWLTVRWEDLCEKTEAVLGQIAEFLSVESNSRVTRIQQAHLDPDRINLGTAAARLSNEQIAAFMENERNVAHMKLYGYLKEGVGL